VWPIHGRPDRNGDCPGDFRADRVDLFAFGRGQRRGLAPQPDEFGTADFVESVVECTGDGAHAEVKGKPDADGRSRLFSGLKTHKSRKSIKSVCRISGKIVNP
jgi:hypothetical protein